MGLGPLWVRRRIAGRRVRRRGARRAGRAHRGDGLVRAAGGGRRMPRVPALRDAHATVFGVGVRASRLARGRRGAGRRRGRRRRAVRRQGRQAARRDARGRSASRAPTSGPRTRFIANVVKCRPPGNRDPLPDEVEQLPPVPRAPDRAARAEDGPRRRQGREPRAAEVRRADGRACAARPIASRSPAATLPVVATYHPAYLLRSPDEKAKAWADLCFARSLHERAARTPADRVSAARRGSASADRCCRCGAGCADGGASRAACWSRRTARTAR